METNEYEMLSVSEVAKRQGTSKQTIYNQIKSGLWETMTYQRGKYKGILVKYPKK